MVLTHRAVISNRLVSVSIWGDLVSSHRVDSSNRRVELPSRRVESSSDDQKAVTL